MSRTRSAIAGGNGCGNGSHAFPRVGLLCNKRPRGLAGYRGTGTGRFWSTSSRPVRGWPPACPCGCRVHVGGRRRPAWRVSVAAARPGFVSRGRPSFAGPALSARRCTVVAVVSVNVRGGTGAGRRRVRELPAWVCRCPEIEEREVVGGWLWRGRFRRQPGERYSCSGCGERRPGGRGGG
jgi:hypothetical protein